MTEKQFGLIARGGALVPLTEVKALGTIAGRGAKVKLRQVFENKETGAIEAVYKFPLPEGSTVCRFKAVIGDRVTEGAIEEKNKAFELYDEALTRGDGAYLLDQERPNIFTLSVGNLNPGARASVEIDYITLLDAKGKEVRFCLPTTISPRYVPERTPDEDGIPVDHKINPPIAFEVPYRLAIDLKIEGRGGISSIESPSHPVSLKFEDHIIKAEFTSENAAMDRDFVLTIHYKDLFQNRGYFYRNEKGSFYQVDLCSMETEGEKASDSNKEVIFLLDCSGSMQGNSINEAKTALEIFLKALKEGTRFNLYRFGSTYEKVFQESILYNSENLRLMLSRLKGINADLGGTEILAPLKEIYGLKVSGGVSRDVILITDGQIGNESEIMGLTKNADKGFRLFTVGIGYGPNEYFVRQLARMAGGTSEMIAPGERIEPKILRLFKKVMSRRLNDLKIHWDKESLYEEQAPSQFSLFEGESVSIFTKIKRAANPMKEITLSFEDGRGSREFAIPVHELQGEESPVDLLWARERVRGLEEATSDEFQRGSRQAERREKKVRKDIITLSRDFGILSRETSFLAIEKRTGDDKTMTEVVLRKVPVMLTRGWGGVEHPDMARVMDQPVTFYSFSHRVKESRQFIGVRRAVNLENSEGGFFERSALKSIGTPTDDILLRILSSQRAEGGFEIDEGLARSLGISMADLEKASTKMEGKEKADQSILLSTAIVLQVLKMYFEDRRSMWEGLVEKTERWFQREISRKEPQIEGVPLWDWAFRFVKTLGFQR